MSRFARVIHLIKNDTLHRTEEMVESMKMRFIMSVKATGRIGQKSLKNENAFDK